MIMDISSNHINNKMHKLKKTTALNIPQSQHVLITCMLKQEVGASPCLVSAENGSQDSIPFLALKMFIHIKPVKVSLALI